MSKLGTLCRALGMLLVSGLACRPALVVAASGANTGLDLTEPLTSFSLTYQDTYFKPGATGDLRTFETSLGLGNKQLKMDFAGHKGDTTLQYNYVFASHTEQFAQTIGTSAVFPNNGDLSAHEFKLGPVYQLSYRPTDSMTLLFLAKYEFGSHAATGSPRYNELTISPYAAVSLPADSYLAVIPEFHNHNGGIHSSTYDAKLQAGRVISGYLNLSAFYEVPLNAYTYENLYRSSYGVRLGIQLF